MNTEGGGSHILKWFCALLLVCILALEVHAASSPGMLPLADEGESEVSGWLMSEKLDGVRGYWDGERLWSRNGTLLRPPPAFTAGLPPFPLEGELWGGRRTFERTVSTVLQQEPHEGWLQLQFAIFDAPREPGSFSRRIGKTEAWFAAHPTPYAFVIPQTSVRDRDHLQVELQRVESLGGEGLIVRDPEALYIAGRTSRVLKVKNFEDAEAKVVAHLPGKGRNAGRLGALLVELPDGTRFRIGTGFSDAERESPPPVGEIVTFTYHGTFASGTPRFPSYLRVRRDQGL